MKKNIIITLLAAATLTSCGEYNKLLKSTDYEYKYEAAKNYFAKGQYNRSATLLNELITILKGTDKAEESLYMLGMSYYNQKDYQTAAQTFITYFNTYPRGTFTELARFHAGKALFLDTPEPRLEYPRTRPYLHGNVQVRPCSWILRNHVWTNRVLIRLSNNYRCSWNTFRIVSRSRKLRI